MTIDAEAVAFRILRTIDTGDLESELILGRAESGFKQGIRYAVSNHGGPPGGARQNCDRT